MQQVKIFKLYMLFDGLYFSTLITSLYAVHIGLRLSDVVLAQAIYSTTVFLMEIPTGLIADRFGKKTSMVLSSLVGNTGIIIFLLSPNLATLLIMRILQATGNALNSGSWEALLYDTTKKHGLNYKRIIGSIMATSTLGQALTGVAVAVILKIWGVGAYVPLFWMTIATQLCSAAAAYLIKEQHIDTTLKESKRVLNIAIDSFNLFRRNSVLFALAAVGFLTVANEYFMYQTYGPFITQNGVDAFWVGAIFTIGLCLNALLQRNIYRLERFLTLEKILACINFVVAAAYLLLALTPGIPALILASIVVIGFANVERPIVSDYANQEVDSKIRATVLSGFSLTSRVSKLLLTFLVGAVMTGSNAAVGYAIHAGYIALGMVIGWWLLVRCGCVHMVSHTESKLVAP